jgi:hypothetical protein
MALAGMAAAGTAVAGMVAAGTVAAGMVAAGTAVEAIAGNCLEKHARWLNSVPTGRAL